MKELHANCPDVRCNEKLQQEFGGLSTPPPSIVYSLFRYSNHSEAIAHPPWSMYVVMKNR